MAYCKNCGSVIDDGATFCTSCGASQGPAPVKDEGGIGWGLLGCCIPIVGLILFLVWKDTKPSSAKAAGLGALISFVSGIVMYLLMFLIGFASVYA